MERNSIPQKLELLSSKLCVLHFIVLLIPLQLTLYIEWKKLYETSVVHHKIHSPELVASNMSFANY